MELKPCPICGGKLIVHSPEDWKPTFYDPDSGGDPYNFDCDCGFHFYTNIYDDYEEALKLVNTRTPTE